MPIRNEEFMEFILRHVNEALAAASLGGLVAVLDDERRVVVMNKEGGHPRDTEAAWKKMAQAFFPDLTVAKDGDKTT